MPATRPVQRSAGDVAEMRGRQREFGWLKVGMSSSEGVFQYGIRVRQGYEATRSSWEEC